MEIILYGGTWKSRFPYVDISLNELSFSCNNVDME